MTLPNNLVKNTLLAFTASYIENYQSTHQHLPHVDVDKDWISPCEVGKFNDDKIHWQPVEIDEQLNFENVGQALGLSIHQDIQDYFSCVYSESIDAESEDGKLSLLLPWNKDDFERLQQNLIGHIMMKQKLKQSITLFFAVTDEDDMIISLDNESGEVWVEQVGCVPHKKLANNLVEFLESLTPIANSLNEEA
ncbi:SecY-interacting protein [Pseudocolwellia sp. HL-MZ19]|uniref:SecY-interacting protein n=1 Tax=unclassified Pseudocolwellia TaxID=2848178 RepID=UPI003CED5F51